jgi:hypothetical protein
MTRVAVIGNCQARPLAEMMKAVFDVAIESIAVVHLLRSAQENEYSDAFKKADIILAQQVFDSYPCEFVRSSDLRAKYGQKVSVWVNLYYAGYNPELMYVRPAARAHMVGPLGDYHIGAIISAFQESLSAGECATRLVDVDWNRHCYQGAVERSLKELRQRETQALVPITDLIESAWTERRLFHTFNHPTAFLLLEYVYRLGRKLGLSVKRRLNRVHFGEPLGQFVVPVNSYVSNDYSVAVEDSLAFRGVRIEFDGRGIPTVPQRQVAYYSPLELVEGYFRVYAANVALISEVAPNFRVAS